MRRENHPTAEESKADADAAQAERSAAQAERDAAAQARVAEAVLANARQRADVALRKLNRTDGVEALPKRDPPADLLTAAAPGLASLRKRDPGRADQAEGVLRDAQAMLPPPTPTWTREGVIAAHAVGADP